MKMVYDLIVVGGGIAGVTSALAAANYGLTVKWICPCIEPNIQSLQWHGYIHRGHLYDAILESHLIKEMEENWSYWSHPNLNDFLKDDITPMIISAGNNSLINRDHDVIPNLF